MVSANSFCLLFWEPSQHWLELQALHASLFASAQTHEHTLSPGARQKQCEEPCGQEGAHGSPFAPTLSGLQPHKPGPLCKLTNDKYQQFVSGHISRPASNSRNRRETARGPRMCTYSHRWSLPICHSVTKVPKQQTTPSVQIPQNDCAEPACAATAPSGVERILAQHFCSF